MSPLTASLIALNSACVFSTISIISSALLRRMTPSGVSVILWLPLIKSFCPNSFSKSCNCLDNVGCVKCKTLAARVIEHSLATVKKYFKTLISIKSVPFYQLLICILSSTLITFCIGNLASLLG